MKQCQCNHDPYWLNAAIKGARYPQKFREVDGKYELFCEVCGGLWDHRATDRLMDLIVGDECNRRGIGRRVSRREGETAPNETRIVAPVEAERLRREEQFPTVRFAGRK